MQTYESFKQIFHQFRRKLVKGLGKRPESYIMYTWFPTLGIVIIKGRDVYELWTDYQKYQRMAGVIE